MDKHYAYFPGCSLGSTGTAYTESIRYVAPRLGIELREIDDWNCCGTSAARATSDDLMYALPARSLALSEQQMPGMDVVAPCTGCYAALKQAAAYARESEGNRAHVSDLIEMDYRAQSDVLSMLEILVEPDAIAEAAEKAVNTLGGMKVACYYGCAQVRPAGLTDFDDPENPTKLEGLLDALGAECIDWSFKTECCGASNHIVEPKGARRAAERILRNAVANGAECIATSCPLCWMNLDMRQSQINKEYGTSYSLPVYYFTELVALALGATPDEAGLTYHFGPADAYALSKLAPRCAPAEESPDAAADEPQPDSAQPASPEEVER